MQHSCRCCDSCPNKTQSASTPPTRSSSRTRKDSTSSLSDSESILSREFDLPSLAPLEPCPTNPFQDNSLPLSTPTERSSKILMEIRSNALEIEERLEEMFRHLESISLNSIDPKRMNDTLALIGTLSSIKTRIKAVESYLAKPNLANSIRLA